MGSVAGFDQYSEALASSRQTWTEDLLAEFIMAPQSIVPDTSMAWEGTQSIETAATIAGLICSNRD